MPGRDRKIGVNIVGNERDLARALKASERNIAQFSRQVSTNLGHVKTEVRGGADVTRLFAETWKLVKWPVIVGGANLAAVSVEALAAGAVSLVTALAPAVGLLPAVGVGALAFKQGIGVAKLALDGIGPVLKQAGVNQKAYHDALVKLPPAQREIVKTLVPFKKELTGLRQVAAAGILDGLRDGLRAVRPLLDPLEGIVRSTARTLGDLARQAGKAADTPVFRKDFATLGRGNVGILRELGQAAIALVQPLVSIARAAQPVTLWLAQMAHSWADLIADFVSGARQSGSLTRFFESTRDVVGQLIDIVGHLGRALVPVFSGHVADIGRGFLDTIERLATRFDAWTHSAEGRNSIAEFFDNARPVLAAVGRLLSSIVNSFKGIGKGFSPTLVATLDSLSKTFVPAIGQLAGKVSGKFIENIASLAGNIARILGATGGDTGSLTSFVGNMSKLTGALADFLDKHPAFGGFVVNVASLAAIGKATGLSSIAGAVGNLSSSFVSLQRNRAIFGELKALQAQQAGTNVAAGAAGGGLLGQLTGFFKSFSAAAIGGVAISLGTFALSVGGAVLALTGFGILVARFPRQFATIGSTIASIFGGLTGPLQGIVRTVYRSGDDIVGAFEALPGLLATAWRSVTRFFAAIPGAVTGAFRGARSWLTDEGMAIIAGLLGGLVSAFARNIAPWFGALDTVTRRYFSGARTWLIEGGKNVVRGLWDGIRAVWADVRTWFAGLPSKILSALGIASPPRWAIDAGSHIMGGLLKGLAHGAADVGKFFRGLAEDVAGPLAAVWQTITGGFGGGAVSLMGLLARGLTPAEAWIVQHESGGSTRADNPNSTAFGLGQLLLDNRQRIGGLLGFSPDTTDWAQQLAMFRYYYRERYGTAENAKAFWQAHGWYGSGLAPTVFTRPTTIGVGERGPELVSVTPVTNVRPPYAARSMAMSPQRQREINLILDGRKVARGLVDYLDDEVGSRIRLN